MATVKITELDALTTVSESDELLMQDVSDTTATLQGTAKKLTISDIARARYTDSANFTGTLQNGGSNVLVDSDINSTVQAYDSSLGGMVSAFTLPTTDGAAGDALLTDAAGNLDFATLSNTLTGLIASGAISDGQAVVINTDGTVSKVAESGSQSVIGPYTESDPVALFHGRAVYDTTTNKVVTVYRTFTDSRACVGTVSGGSISWGTPVVFLSNVVTTVDICFAATEGKVVIVYCDPNSSDYGYAVVGTVSGTSISFGTRTQASVGATYYMACAYDTAQQRVAVLYRDDAGSNNPEMVIGTISGTSISFGTLVVVSASAANYFYCVYASGAGKIVAAYEQTTNGTLIAGTVSGTTITFGTAQVFDSGYVALAGLGYDSNTHKIMPVYRDVDNSGYGTTLIASLSGTVFTFGTKTAFNSTSTTRMAVGYDSSKSRVLIVYQDESVNISYALIGNISGVAISFSNPIEVYSASTTYTWAIVYDPDSPTMLLLRQPGNGGLTFDIDTSPDNLTAENFIGFASGNYNDSEATEIQIRGTLSEAQTGLTAGQAYYVQLNGTLSTTPDTPSVYAGVAVSSTAIAVKT